jgi:sec-independent protein translocase protein TatC
MARYPNDDLFEGTSMTFGEHLEELRACLFRAVIGIVLGFLVGMLAANQVVMLLTHPLQNALEQYYVDKAIREVDATELPPGVNADDVRVAIETERLIPDSSIRVDVSHLLTMLKTVAPEGFGDLPARMSVFVPNDLPLTQVVPLAKRMMEDPPEAPAPDAAADGAEATEPPIAATLREHLTDEDRKFVSETAKLDADKPVDEETRVRMLQTLNRLIADESLTFEADLVTGLEKTYGDVVYPTAVDLRKKALESRDPADAATFNQLAISTAFPTQLVGSGIPLVDLPTWKVSDVRVQALGASEGFMIWMKAAFFTGMVLASPYVFYQIWLFVSAGLYPHEKKYVYMYLPMSLGLFLAGVMLAYSFVFEPVLSFLFSFNRMTNIDPDPRISEWLGFVLFLPLGFGVSFQLPLVMLFLNRIGIFELTAYTSNWRIAILAIFVISMVLTPSDPYSIFFMAVPLVILYGVGILLCKYMPKGRSRFSEAYEPA